MKIMEPMSLCFGLFCVAYGCGLNCLACGRCLCFSKVLIFLFYVCFYSMLLVTSPLPFFCFFPFFQSTIVDSSEGVCRSLCPFLSQIRLGLAQSCQDFYSFRCSLVTQEYHGSSRQQQRVYELTNLFRSRGGVFAKKGRSGDDRSRDLGQVSTQQLEYMHINHS